MNILKSRYLLKCAIPYIIQVLVKYCLSTGMVRITHLLRKPINKEKTYYNSVWLVLQKYLNRNCNLSVANWSQSAIKNTPSSDSLLTNFAPTSAFLQAGLWSCSGRPSDFPEASPKLTKERPVQHLKKGRSWSGVSRVLLLLTALVFQYLYFSFKALKNIRAFILLAFMFHMFSLSAQTPRKDSGADGPIAGQSDIIPLKIGHKVPEEFWAKEHLFYINGDTVRKTLHEYKGKLLILDFWMIGCSKCFLHQKEINYYKKLYGDKLAVIMVNGVKTKNNYASIHSYLKNEWFRSLGLESFSSIIESSYLDQLLQPAGYPMYYWINQYGILQTVTYRNLLDRDYVAPFLEK